MRLYRVNDDWISHLKGEFRQEALEIIRGLSLSALQKYPPPKIGGLPLGVETRVFSRFISGKSSQLDASAFSSLYRSLASGREKLLYKAFRENQHLTKEEWAGIIGEATLSNWVENKFLRETQEGSFVCRFSIISLDGLLFAVDPLNDHGSGHESVELPEGFLNENGEDGIKTFHHTYIGQDSLRMIEVMEGFFKEKRGRYLDCGPGAGAIFLYFSRQFDEAYGIDINARAVELAKFNMDLNGLRNCRAIEDDAINLNGKYGKFDLISWNLPFIFMPDDWENLFIDGFGGEMGIGLCLRFIDSLPDLISDSGTACVAALSPILKTGENVLEERLKKRLPELGLDCEVVVSQVSLAHTRDLWHFHQSHGIRKFESVYLNLKHGKGGLSRAEAPLTRIIVDTFREKLYQKKFA